MRIIDKTPFQDAQGNIGVRTRVQGALKYGFNWHVELDAQNQTIAQLDRMLDKGFVVIRNFSLPDSDIVIPLTLLGPGTISVILASPVKGHFEAKGGEWNTLKNGTATPARRNLLDFVSKLSRAFQKYLQIHKIQVPVEIEPVLIITDPGAQIEAAQPSVRIVRSDAMRKFVNHLNQANPIMRAEDILKLADRILDPELHDSPPSIETGTSASSTASIAPLTNTGSPEIRPALNRAPAQQRQKPAPQKKAPAVSRTQIILLAGLGLFECCLLVGGAIIFFFFNQ